MSTDTQPTKFCVNCKWFVPFENKDRLDLSKCSNPNTPVHDKGRTNQVTGGSLEYRIEYCDTLRKYGWADCPHYELDVAMPATIERLDTIPTPPKGHLSFWDRFFGWLE